MRYLIAIILAFQLSFATAQIDFYNADTLFVKANTVVYVQGNFTNVHQDFENNGEFSLTQDLENRVDLSTPGLGLFKLIGEDSQGLDLTGNFKTHNLEIDNAEGAIFKGDAHFSVFGDLDFVSGIFYTQDNNLIEFKHDAIYFDASDLSHINGPAIKEGNSQFTFPIGKEGRLRPIRIIETTLDNSLQAEYFRETYSILDTDEPLENVSDWEYWSLDRIYANEDPKISLIWDELSFVNPDIESTVIAFNGYQSWSLVEASTQQPEQLENDLSSDDILPGYGYYTFGSTRRQYLISDGLSDFQLIKSGCDIIITWDALERSKRVASYTIERQKGLEEFELITVKDARNTKLLDTYSFRDNTTDDHTLYRYRITTDYYDGTSTVSNIKFINASCYEIAMSLYPNPVFADDHLILGIESEVDKDLDIKVVDVLGRVLQEKRLRITKGSSEHIIDNLIHYGAAEYFIWTPEEEFIPTLKFQVIR